MLNALKTQIELFDKWQEFLEEAKNSAFSKTAVRMVTQQEEKLKEEIEHYSTLKSNLYRDMVDGIISKEEFAELNARFGKSRDEVEETLRDIAEKKEMIISGQIHFLPWVENLKKYRDITELTRSVVISTIKQVLIHEDKTVEIHFLFEDEMKQLMELSQERQVAEE